MTTRAPSGRPRGRRARRLAGAAAVAAALAACGGGGDEQAGVDAGAGGQVDLGGGPTRTLAGTDEVIVVDLASRSVDVVETGEGRAAAPDDRAAIPGGDGPLIQVTGVQLPDGRWLVGGTECQSVEVADPAGCEPGTYTLAVLDGGRWDELDGVPDELHRSFGTLISADGGRVLLERWDRGRSDYWVVDTAAEAITPVGWSPAPLEVPGGVLGEAELSQPMATRTSCLSDGRLLVVEGRPVDGGLASELTTVDLSAGPERPEVRTAPLGLAETALPHRLLCPDGGQPHLVAEDSDTRQALAFPVDAEALAVARPLVSAHAGGEIADVSFGQGAVAVGWLAGEPVSRIDEPSGPDDPGTIETIGEVDVEVFRDGRWDAVGAPVALGERVHPTPGADDALVVVDPTASTLRTTEG